MTPRHLLLPFLAGVTGLLPAFGARQLTIEPAPVDRAGVVATFELPANMPLNLAVRDGNTVRPLQVDRNRRATFVVAEIGAGETKSFALEEVAVVPLSGAVKADIENDGIVKIAVAGAPLFNFWAKDEPLPNATVSPKLLRGGHIHPLRSPSGKILTASYPADHLHHHGIWAAWTKTRFQGRETDFWNMGRSEAKVEFAGLDRIWSGPVHGGFASRQRYVDSSSGAAVIALNETWVVTVFDVSPRVRVFDLVSTQLCATEDPLLLPQYHYGGLGFRGRDEWLGEENLHVLTSEGETDRVKAHLSRVRWCHVGGNADGSFAGVAVLGHPANFRAPQPIRLHPREPFLCFSPSQLGDWEIRPGEPYVARYRFVVMDGAPDPRVLDADWNGYAQPARVSLTER